jgi:hypothetical protein
VVAGVPSWGTVKVVAAPDCQVAVGAVFGSALTVMVF